MRNKYKHKRFGWDDIEAKKEFDEKYKFYVLLPLINWALGLPYKECTRCKKNVNLINLSVIGMNLQM